MWDKQISQFKKQGYAGMIISRSTLPDNLGWVPSIYLHPYEDKHFDEHGKVLCQVGST